MSISFFLLPLFSVAAHSSETHGRYSALHRTVQYHTMYQKNCIDPTISYRNKKTYESTEPQLGLLKTSPTEELED